MERAACRKETPGAKPRPTRSKGQEREIGSVANVRTIRGGRAMTDDELIAGQFGAVVLALWESNGEIDSLSLAQALETKGWHPTLDDCHLPQCVAIRHVCCASLCRPSDYADEIRAILEPLAGRLKSLVVATCLAGDLASLQDDGACGEQVVSARQGMHLV